MSQALFKGHGQGPNIKLGDKKEFGQLITSLEACNFNLHMLKLLFECDLLE